MKLYLNRTIRIALISIISIIICTVSFLLYREFNIPSFEEQKISKYTYSNNGSINYKVFLKPNKLYDENYLDEGKLYMNGFIDHILANFNYEFSGDSIAQISGNYDIAAQVKGFTSDGEKQKIIWQKNFPISRNKTFNSNDHMISINEEIRIRLDEYNAFAKEIIEASGVSCQTNLSIVIDIDVKAVTDKGTVEETISPSMVIPLNASMFEVFANNIVKPGVIEETKQVQLPVGKKQVIPYGIILGVLAIALIILIFFTEGIVNIRDPYEKLLQQIFKKHGDRLVALNSNLNVDIESAYEVLSIEDLVRLADEVGKPILYKYSSDYKEIDKFYLTNDDEVYILDANHMLEEIESKKKNNDASNEAEELMDKVKKFKSQKVDDKEESGIES